MPWSDGWTWDTSTNQGVRESQGGDGCSGITSGPLVHGFPVLFGPIVGHHTPGSIIRLSYPKRCVRYRRPLQSTLWKGTQATKQWILRYSVEVVTKTGRIELDFQILALNSCHEWNGRGGKKWNPTRISRTYTSEYGRIDRNLHPRVQGGKLLARSAM